MFNKKMIKKGGEKKPKKYGNKLEVWKGLALQTSSGITKDGLKYNAKGDVVYKKASNVAKKKNNLGGFIENARKTPGVFKKQPKKGTPKYYELLNKSKNLIETSTEDSSENLTESLTESSTESSTETLETISELT